MIPHSRPCLGPEEEEAVSAVVRSGRLAGGDRVSEFERDLARRVATHEAVAVSSGTAALHLALRALGVGPGDQVAIPSFVCSALLHAVRYEGADPLVIDVDPVSFNLDPKDLRKRATSRTRAVILPHMFGLPCDVGAVEAFGIPVIEDCAMSLGAKTNGTPVGGFGEISIFSFYATKMVASGEGGMVATDRRELSERVRDLRDYDGREDGQLRFNYKMSDLHAAVGTVQLGKLDAFVGKRRSLAARYGEALSDRECRLPSDAPDHIFFRYVVRTDREAGDLVGEFEKKGVAARRPVFYPLHRMLGITEEEYPGTEAAYRSAVSIPLYPALTEAEVEKVIKSAQEVLR